MDKLDNEQFAVGHYLQSLLKAPSAESDDSAVAPQVGKKYKLICFRVGKLKCAVEHRFLAGIQPILETPTPCGGKAPDWLLGYMAESAQQARIIDLRALMQGGAAQVPEIQGQQRLIALQQGRFAVIADEILGGETVYESQITWRGQSSRRPWLAGLQQSGLIILDVPGLQAMLST